jgi:hypothetical protein
MLHTARTTVFKERPINRPDHKSGDAAGVLRKDPGKIHAVGVDVQAASLRGPFNAHDQLPALRAAVFIDFENVGGFFRPFRDVPIKAPMLEWLDAPSSRCARMTLCRVYANQEKNSCEAYRRNGGILADADIVDVKPIATGKNGVDMRMAVDVVETAYTRPDIGVFVLASSDSDFVPVVQMLRRMGKIIVGVGSSSANPNLTAAFSRYSVLQDPTQWLIGRRTVREQDDADRLLLMRTVAGMGATRALRATVCARMKQADPSFGKGGRYGMAKTFTGFLRSQSDLVCVVGEGDEATVELRNADAASL